ncbi:hypothetical protein VTK26DRAFT_2442 [Humicola hyalothermophila]
MAQPQPQPGSDESEIAQWLDNVDKTMGFKPASALAMSCGTVTLDLRRAMVLVIWNNRFKLYQLPKGRRNMDESMFDAAVRETYEETGFRVTPLELEIATRATPSKTEGSGPVRKSPDVIEGYRSKEFIGACLSPDPQSDTEALKIVYYYAAMADSTAAPDTDTQEEWEDLKAKWIPLSEVASTLRFVAEVKTVMKAVEDIKNSGYTIGEC